MKDCITVSGTVASVRHEDDGDIHINLALPATERHLLNQANISEEDGDLVTEIVPADQPGCTPGQPPPLPSSAYRTPGYTYGTCTGADITAPAVGERVTVTGPYVLDKDHGWMEVHPVWAIAPGNAPAASGSAHAPAPTLTHWSEVNTKTTSTLARVAVSYKQRPATVTRCRRLLHAVKGAQRSPRPPGARSAWRKALKNLRRAASAGCGGRAGTVHVRLHVGLRALVRFARFLARHGVHLGATMLAVLVVRKASGGRHSTRHSAATQPPVIASPATTTPAPPSTAPAPPSTAQAPPSTAAPPPPTTTAPPPPTTTIAAPPPTTAGAWCTASAAPANDGYAGDYDVFVHSNQPYTEATASDATDTYSYETNATGYADIFLWTQFAGEHITVTVGAASCSTSA